MTGVVRLGRQHPRDLFRQVARLHSRSIHHGVLPQLGLRFLTEVYAAVAHSDHGIVLVVKEGEMILGFVAGTIRLKRLYLGILLKRGWCLFAAVGMRFRQVSLWKKMWSVLSFPGRQTRPQVKYSGGPELLAIAVTEDQRRTGLGSQLLQAFENELRERSAGRTYSVATNAAEAVSNRFYEKSGFHPIGKMAHHQLVLQLYLKEL